jgi:hypothetical protein
MFLSLHNDSMGARNPCLDVEQRTVKVKDTLRVLPVSKASATVPQQDNYLISGVSWAQLGPEILFFMATRQVRVAWLRFSKLNSIPSMPLATGDWKNLHYSKNSTRLAIGTLFSLNELPQRALIPNKHHKALQQLPAPVASPTGNLSSPYSTKINILFCISREGAARTMRKILGVFCAERVARSAVYLARSARWVL